MPHVSPTFAPTFHQAGFPPYYPHPHHLLGGVGVVGWWGWGGGNRGSEAPHPHHISPTSENARC